MIHAHVERTEISAGGRNRSPTTNVTLVHQAWGNIMNRIIARTAAAAVLVVGLAGCGGTASSVAACERASFALIPDLKAGQDLPDAKKPAACEGLSDAQLEAIGEKALAAMFSAASIELPTFAPPSTDVVDVAQDALDAAKAAADRAKEAYALTDAAGGTPATWSAYIEARAAAEEAAAVAERAADPS